MMSCFYYMLSFLFVQFHCDCGARDFGDGSEYAGGDCVLQGDGWEAERV